jgi:hypothetical protein
MRRFRFRWRRYEIRWRTNAGQVQTKQITDPLLEYRIGARHGFLGTVGPMRTFEAKREAVRQDAIRSVEFYRDGELIGECAKDGNLLRWRLFKHVVVEEPDTP